MPSKEALRAQTPATLKCRMLIQPPGGREPLEVEAPVMAILFRAPVPGTVDDFFLVKIPKQLLNQQARPHTHKAMLGMDLHCVRSWGAAVNLLSTLGGALAMDDPDEPFQGVVNPDGSEATPHRVLKIQLRQGFDETVYDLGGGEEQDAQEQEPEAGPTPTRWHRIRSAGRRVQGWWEAFATWARI